MSKLDQFIREHAEMFDDQEPANGHFDRFEERLERFHAFSVRHTPVRLWMKIAAGLLIFLTAGLAIFELATRDFSGRTSLQQASMGLPDELASVLAIYENRTTQQLDELNQLVKDCPGGQGLVHNTRQEIALLDRNRDELVTAVKENPSDNRAQTALIQNCKAKELLLSDVILNEKMKKCE